MIINDKRALAYTVTVDETKNLILDILGSNEIELVKKNKGLVMKTIMPILKGKVDMAIANEVIGGLLV